MHSCLLLVSQYDVYACIMLSYVTLINLCPLMQTILITYAHLILNALIMHLTAVRTLNGVDQNILSLGREPMLTLILTIILTLVENLCW